MKKQFYCLLLASLLFFCLCFQGYSQKKIVRQADTIITASPLKEYVDYLASDSLKGRETPSPGLDSAGAYIARQFHSFGLKPLNGSYFQDLAYCYFDLGDNLALSVSDLHDTLAFLLKTDFIPYEFSASSRVEAPVVFAGYGITAPEYNYDDYRNIDVQGKIVVVLRQEPGQTDSTWKDFEGMEMSHYSGVKEKMQMAKDHGAVAMLVVSGPLHYNSMKPRGYPWSALSKTLPRDILPLGYCDTRENIPVVHIGEAVVNALIGSADSLKKLQVAIESGKIPHSFLLTGKTVQLTVSLTSKPVGGRNVIGYLEGSDPLLKNQVVVIGAHYDHLGFLKVHRADTDYIYNGADDNASGTSGVISIARAYSRITEKPKRSLLFMAFAGEEKGLLGSNSYVRNPLIPLDQTVAMLNLDMIGRNFADSLQLIGARQNPGLIRIIRKQNKQVGFILALSKSKHMGGGSDHVNFFNKGIPAIFFFTGLHPDYHQTSDNPDRINDDKVARVSRLVFLTSWYIVNDNHRYKIIKSEDKKQGNHRNKKGSPSN